MNRESVKVFFSSAGFEVLVTALLMVVNETTLALLIRTGNMPDGLDSWPLWRLSLLVAAGIVVLSQRMGNSLGWTVPLLLLFAWLLLAGWYAGIAFWYWQIPVVDMRDLCVPPLFGMFLAGGALFMHGMYGI
ncbi:hypothetical protein [Pantoea cypripedii]|uniref:Uncharacterized protein n=1 Tax=Pantoea cypripedii TaxID=55209 RepID=A0A1X1EM93_PANCY|nr:hypothetical protein [Pantoea cypripedii]MBP2200571.1 hypothetical protein [Pantoea cypripedii]ORM90067.1 hypothetical protein HA50_26205 [Pantoea cypripedii]